ncbi:coiled-coil domain-containing protein 186-like isoform X2 [Sitophilus oryzae]|uniref:Coiled-coil domain-containing protein 186-like isoform X2 n=1 Tax=Sitophilus oryzae TaxID=7048 RepID=A0A6J2XGG9_SITOR|nr:coiled-coil domain-containing protein 186-like isoform X2 [Sitophilus oryzae]
MDKPVETQSNEDELDIQFKEILCEIRKHIPFINSNAYLFQCRIWLEKLSGPDMDKVLRNLYLIELCNQIENNKLCPPFNEAPPAGNLKSFSRISMKMPNKSILPQIQSRSNLSRSAKALISAQQKKANKRYAPKDIQGNIEKYLERERDHSKGISDIFVPIDTIKPIKSTIKPKSTQLPMRSQSQTNKFSCGEPIHSSHSNIKCETSANDKTECISREIAIDGADDSWSDITDQDEEIDDNTIKCEIDKDKECPKVVEERSTKPAETSEQRTIVSQTEEDNIIFSYNLKDMNFISEDWKKTIAALQLRLSEMTHQNDYLNSIIQKMEIKIDETNAQHQAEISNLEYEHSNKIETLKNNFHEQIRNKSKINDELINKKDEEIFRLTDIIQKRCQQISNEISSLQNHLTSCECDKKLGLLKKCVSKMDKTFKRSEREYLRQIEKLKEDLNSKEISLQIQLNAQKTELLKQTNVNLEEEFNKKLNALEIKYIKMLEEHEQEMMEKKKHDEEEIVILKQLLTRHGISYDNIDV